MALKSRHQHSPSQRLLIVMPPWLGETVMATPTVRALRDLYPDAEIIALVRSHLKPVLEGGPWIDHFITAHRRKDGKGAKKVGSISLARKLAKKQFDTAVVLPNGFRAAMLVRTAGIKRRVGYDRDGRGGLLSDKLLPRRATGKFIPVPTIEYYLGIPRYLGANVSDTSMALFTDSETDQRADALLTDAGWRAESGHPLVVVSPGALHGSAKVWDPSRFAVVADQLAKEHNAVIAVNGAAKERAILDRMINTTQSDVIDLQAKGIDLGVLKSIIRRADLVVGNDTGPRHIAAAFSVPVVTVFGPTDPVWGEINFKGERQVYAEVYCRPCQKKKCPLRNTPEDHQCMTMVDAELVYEQASGLLRERREQTDELPIAAEGNAKS